MDGFDTLIERGLLVEVESGRAAFRHTLTCESIYGNIATLDSRLLTDAVRRAAELGMLDPHTL